MDTDATDAFEHDLIGGAGLFVWLTYLTEGFALRVRTSGCQPSPLTGKSERSSDFEQVNPERLHDFAVSLLPSTNVNRSLTPLIYSLTTLLQSFEGADICRSQPNLRTRPVDCACEPTGHPPKP